MTKNDRGDFQLVVCKLWENWHGATSLEASKDQLKKDHKSLTFVGWVVDDISELKLNFLSPNVLWVEKWVDSEDGIEFRKVYRSEIEALK